MADHSEHDFDEYTEDSEKDEIVYGGGAMRHRNEKLASHYTKRDPARKRARQAAMAKRRAAVSSARSSGKKSSTRQAAAQNFFPSWLAGPINAVFPGLLTTSDGSSQKKRSAAKRRTAALRFVGILVAVVVLATFALLSAYQSKTMFADSMLDDNAIQERLITDKANKDKVTYFLIVGVDKSSMLTDCIWLMCFDNAAHKMNVMQIPRDTYVGSDSSSPHKINGVYGSPKTVDWCGKCGRAVTEDEIDNDKHTVCGRKIEQKTESNISALIRCINTRLSLPVDHYVLFDFEGFEKVVDAMGGVDIYLDEETKVYPNKYEYDVLPAGDNHLDGSMALKFMRNRKIYFDGDLGRVKAQRSIIHAMMDKVSDMSTLEMLFILRAAYGNFQTDMSLEEIRSFISPVKKCSPESLNMFTMPGTDHWVKPHPSYYVCHEEKTVEAINEYLMPYGDKLTEEDINFPVLYD